MRFDIAYKVAVVALLLWIAMTLHHADLRWYLMNITSLLETIAKR